VGQEVGRPLQGVAAPFNNPIFLKNKYFFNQDEKIIQQNQKKKNLCFLNGANPKINKQLLMVTP
jgi:hypothetical protein